MFHIDVGIYNSILAVESITRSVIKRKNGLGYETKPTIINKMEALEDLRSADLNDPLSRHYDLA